jgi:hypothetical protein
MKTIIAALILFALAAPATAMAYPLPPQNGFYHSLTQGGTVLDGRFSESWMGPGQEGATGNTLNVQSWDGSSLGGEWRLSCASIVGSPTLVSDTRVGGTGEVTYRTNYAGGQLWLAKQGPWSIDHLTDFTGTLSSLIVTSTHQYVANIRIGIRSNVTVTGMLDALYPSWSPTCLDYMIANTSVFGSTATGSLPAGYPAFLDPASCPSGTGTLSNGAWGSVTQLTMVLTGCAVPTETVSWGSLKARYTE